MTHRAGRVAVVIASIAVFVILALALSLLVMSLRGVSWRSVIAPHLTSGVKVSRDQYLDWVDFLKYSVTFAGGAITFLTVAKRWIPAMPPRPFAAAVVSWVLMILTAFLQWALALRLTWIYGRIEGYHIASTPDVPIWRTLEASEVVLSFIAGWAFGLCLVAGIVCTGYALVRGYADKQLPSPS